MAVIIHYLLILSGGSHSFELVWGNSTGKHLLRSKPGLPWGSRYDEAARNAPNYSSVVMYLISILGGVQQPPKTNKKGSWKWDNKLTNECGQTLYVTVLPGPPAGWPPALIWVWCMKNIKRGAGPGKTPCWISTTKCNKAIRQSEYLEGFFFFFCFTLKL